MMNIRSLSLCRVRSIFIIILLQFIAVFANAQTPCVAPYNPTPASTWGMVQKFQTSTGIWNGGTPTAADALRKAELAVQTTKFIRAIDSLKTLTKDYFELHHPFDQVYIIEKDLPNYYKLIEMVKRIKNKKIVIVSAADCNGSLEYNEDLSTRRASRIYRTLSKLSNNDVVIQNVGERELLKDCTEARKDIEAQVVNRYSYIFIENLNN